MAGVNYEKYKTSQKVKSVMRHCDKDMRAEATHQNEHIDLSKTKYNTQLKRNYEQTKKRFDERMDWLEAQPNKNKRSDKVICFGLEIPLPEDMPHGKEVEWTNKVYHIVSDMYGKDNVMNVYYHADEQHDYMDSATKQTRTSRKHVHLLVVPEIDGRLNGRDFSARRNMNKLNNAIHEMSLHDYGCKFMDGSKRKSKSTVEELKRQSEKAEIEALQEQKQALQEQIDSLKPVLSALEARKRALEDFNEEISSKSSIEAFKGKLEGKTASKRITGKIVKTTKEKLQKRANQADLLTSDIQGVSAEGVYHSLGE